jgi:hypothetical protein
MIADVKDPRERFFAYARERHQIYLNRAAGQPRPWTEEPVLQQYRFTNVFRELDKTTLWFRDKVREPLRDSQAVLPATVLFRMLNRIETGEAVFCQRDLITGESAFDLYMAGAKVGVVRDAVHTFVGKRGPYVTGAYIISTPPDSAKLEGALKIVDGFKRGRAEYTRHADGNTWPKMGWKELSLALLNEPGSHTLEGVFDWLRQFPYLGSFHSYEIVTDLRHTSLLRRASDVLTWANMGPGAQRGLNRIAGRAKETDGRDRWGTRIKPAQAIEEMKGLLRDSRDAKLWPQGGKATAKAAQNALYWPKWELREVEHTLCEFDKFERTRLGEGRPRGVFA